MIMIVRLALVCAGIGIAAMAAPAGAQPVHTPHIICRLLLPSQPIPDNPGHLVSIREVTVLAGHDGHWHLHDPVEYVRVISGNGTLLIDTKPEVPLSPGTVAIVPKRTPHMFRNASETETLVFTAIFLETEKDREITKYLGEPDTLNGCPHRAG